MTDSDAVSKTAGPATGSGGSSFSLESVLQLGHDQGINGGALADHLVHSLAFVDLVKRVGTDPTLLVDLGTGGGYPGLIVATELPTTEVILVEARQKRADYLTRATHALGISERVRVFNHDASALTVQYRNSVDAVTARSFGPPAAVAECGAPLLKVGGCIVVSEPPTGTPSRWPTTPLTELGLRVSATLAVETDGFVVLEKFGTTPERYPRNRKQMQRQPLF